MANQPPHPDPHDPAKGQPGPHKPKTQPSLPPDDEVVIDEIEIVEEGKPSSRRRHKAPPTAHDDEIIDVADVEVLPDSSKSHKRPTVPASEDALDVGEVEIVESASSIQLDAVEVVEEPSGKKPPPKKPAAPTMIGPKGAPPTMLAPADEVEPIGGPPPAKKPAAPTMMGKAPPPTMLAGPDAEREALGLPPDMPRMEIDSGRAGRPGDSDILDAAEVVEEVLEAAPASDPRMEGLDPVEVVDSGKAPRPAGIEPTEPILEVSEEVLDVDEVIEVTEEASSKKPRPKPKRGGTDLDVIDEEVLVEGESEIDLGKKGGPRGAVASGVDLIAEALESGVDLAGSDAKSGGPPAKKDKAHDALDLENILAPPPESSAVDLGSAPSAKKKPPKVDEVEEVIDEAVEEVTEAVTPPKGKTRAAKETELLAGEDAIDEIIEEVEGASARTKSKAAAGQPTELVDDDDVFHIPQIKREGKPKSGDDEVVSAVDEVIDDEVMVAPKGKAPPKKMPVKPDADVIPEGDDEPPKKKKAPRARGGAGKVLVGMLLGIVLLGGGLAAVWAFAPDLLESIPAASNGAKWQKATPPQQPIQAQKPSDAAQAREMIAQGKFQDAIDKLGEVAPEDKEGLTTRGVAKWQKYLSERLPKGLPLNLKDPDAVAALKDLDDAKAKEDPYPLPVLEVVEADKSLRGRIAALEKLEKADQAIRAMLHKAGLIPNPDVDLVKAMNDVVAKGAGSGQLIASIEKALIDAKLSDGKDKLTAASFAKLANDLGAKMAELPKTILSLEAARKALDGRLTSVNDALKAAGAKGEEGAGVKELVTARDTLTKQKAALDGAIADALEELKRGGVLPAGGDAAKQLVEGTKAARLKGESPLGASLNNLFSGLSGLGAGAGKMLQKTVEMADQSVELAAARARAALSETPEQRLDTVVAMYRGRDRKDPQDLARAAKFVEWVNSKDAKATAELKAKALWALGLAQRNQGDMAAAVKTLGNAAALAGELKSAPWAADVGQSLKELTDPAAYYLPRAHQLIAAGQPKAAVEELTAGLKAMPGHPQLLAVRGVIHVEAGGPAAQALVRADAAALQKSPEHAAGGFYLLGRLEESLGNFSKAEENYRSALKAHQGGEEEANLFRIALARLLLREIPADAPPPPKGKATTSRLNPDTEEDRARLAELVMLTVTGVQAPAGGDGDDEDKGAIEAMKLAESLLKSSDPKTKGQGLMILGAALSKQGKRTEGMLKFVEGMKLFHGTSDAKELEKLVKDHPAFMQPDSAGGFNPLLAERYYGKGLEYFWARRYQDAEEQFAKAVGLFDQDARYFYFLGLARYQQKARDKRDAAAFAFTQGAALEAASRPHSTQVNLSLERVQGEARQALNGVRQKLARGGP